MILTHHFTPGEEPEVLTCTSPLCALGKHAECSGILSVSGLRAMGAELRCSKPMSEDETVFCICACHKKPGNA